MIVNGDGENFFGVILTNDMLVEKGFDDIGLLEIENGFFVGSLAWRLLFAQFAIDDGFANSYAGITDKNTRRTCDHLFHFPLWFSTKGTEVDFGRLCHPYAGSVLGLFRHHLVDQAVLLRFFG